jgi:hypothetical protein
MKVSEAARTMNKRRWQSQEGAKVNEAARALVKRRWKQRPDATGGRPPDPDRCPCGIMTRARAQKRGHKC